MKTIVIPDIHQNIEFPKRILKEFYQEGDSIVFLGDYFDSMDPITSIDETCDFLHKLLISGLDVTFLIGNHDISYYESIKLSRTKSRYKTTDPLYAYCSGYTKNKSRRIFDYFKHSNFLFFRSLKMHKIVGDFLLVHAGYNDYHFRPFLSVQDNLREWENELEMFKNSIGRYTILNDCSEVRTGRSHHSSPIWLDYHNEFQGIPEFRQIVGHTYCDNDLNMMRKCNNFCIDNNQTTFALIQDKHKIQIRDFERIIWDE